MPENLDQLPGTGAVLDSLVREEQSMSPGDLVCYVGQPNTRMQPGDVGRVSSLKPANPETHVDIVFDGKTMTFHREKIIPIRLRCHFA